MTAIPYLSDNARYFYRKFLDKSFPRAFVINERGGASSYYRGYDLLGRALADCKCNNERCAAYAVDDCVVWKPLSTVPRDKTYALSNRGD